MELAARQWRMVDKGSAFGKMFITHNLIPFVPLTDVELRKVGPLSTKQDGSEVHLLMLLLLLLVVVSPPVPGIPVPGR